MSRWLAPLQSSSSRPHLPSGAGQLGPGHGEVSERAHRLVQGHLVGLLGLLEDGAGDRTFLVKFSRPLYGGVQERQVRPFGATLWRSNSGAGRLLPRFGGRERSGRLPQSGAQFLLAQLDERLALLHPVAFVHENLLHDAARFGLDLLRWRSSPPSQSRQNQRVCGPRQQCLEPEYDRRDLGVPEPLGRLVRELYSCPDQRPMNTESADC